MFWNGFQVLIGGPLDGVEVFLKSEETSPARLVSTNFENLPCLPTSESTVGPEGWVTLPQILWQLRTTEDGMLGEYRVVRGAEDGEVCWMNRTAITSEAGDPGFVDLLQPENLHDQQETFTSSNQEKRIFLVDNDPTTVWNPTPTDELPTFWVNLGEHHSLSGILIDWLAAPETLEVQMSDDGVSWVPVVEVNIAAGEFCGGSQQFVPVSSSLALNWVRLQMLGRSCGQDQTVGIRELSFRADLDFCEPLTLRGFDWEPNCDPLVECEAGILSRRCGKCPDGYTGQGPEDRGYFPQGCVDIDECAEDDPCFLGVECHNLRELTSARQSSLFVPIVLTLASIHLAFHPFVEQLGASRVAHVQTVWRAMGSSVSRRPSPKSWMFVFWMTWQQ